MTTQDDLPLESITISGGDRWTVEELTEFLGHLYVLYNRISVLREERHQVPARLSRQLYASKSRVAEQQKMTVESLTIRSPMEINLRGIAEIIREARQAVKDIYRNPLERRKLEQQIEHEEKLNDVELAQSKLRLLRDANQTMLELGIPEGERRATLKALYAPASEAADMIVEKDLEIDW